MGKTVADLFLEILASHGVKHIFGVIGDAIFPLAEALAKQDRIRYIPAGIENGAAFMASYSAKLSGVLGVCVGTAGPGAAGLISGTGEAFLDGAPLLCLTGQVPTNKLGTAAKQYIQQGQLFSAVTSQTRLCGHPETLAPILRRLIQTALENKTAVHLEIPKDVLAAPAGPDSAPWVIGPVTYEGTGLSYGNLNDFTTAVTHAKNPLLVLGQAARPVADELSQWALRWGAAIVLAQDAKGLIPDSAPAVIGGIGAAFLPECWNEIDFIVLFGEAPFETPFFPGGATVWQIDNAVHAAATAFQQIRSDFRVILAKLEALSPAAAGRAAWNAKISAARQARLVAAKPGGEKDGEISRGVMHPAAFSAMLAEMVKSDAVITLDVGEFDHWFNLGFMADRQTVLLSTHWRGMGAGIPAAIAACCQTPERQVVALVGDGGLLMSIPELSVISRERLPLTVIVYRNQCYGLEEQKMKKEGCPVFGTKLALPDMLKLAESFGIKGYRLTAPQNGAALLQQALAEPPALVEVPVTSPALPYLK